MEAQAELDPRALILEAEATPIFRHQSQPVLDLLSVASQLDPESLEDRWVVRLALRLADVLIMRGELERAGTWLGVARERLPRLEEADGALRSRAALQQVRLQIAERKLEAAGEALQRARAQQARGAAAPLRTLLALVDAELHFALASYEPVGLLLEPLLSQPDAFSSVDELWRAVSLCARAHQHLLDFELAQLHFARLVDMAQIHEAHQEEADARLGLGQSLLGQGLIKEGVEEMRQARGLATGQLWQQAMGLLTTALLADQDMAQATEVAKEAAVAAARADDYATYIQTVGVVTSLYRLQRRHKEAYKDLVRIHGMLQAKFGPEAAAPVRAQIGVLREDLGEEAFEALSAQILAELKAGR